MPLSNPTPGDVHVNMALTNYGQMFMQADDSFVAMRAAPQLPVSFKSNEYFIYDILDFYSDEMAVRAPGTQSAGSGFKLSTTPYNCTVYAHHKDVDDQTRSNADPAVNLEQGATQFTTLKAMIKMDTLFATAYLGTSIWGTDVAGVAAAPGAGQFLRWNESGADPVQDFDTGKQTIISTTGYDPRHAVITYDSWIGLKNNDDIKARLGLGSGATTALPAQVMLEAVARILELDALYVIKSVVNTAGTVDFISKNGALLYYKNETATGMEPQAMTKFAWTGYTGATSSGFRVSRFRMDELRSDRIESEIAPDFKVTAPSLGYFFDNTVAA